MRQLADDLQPFGPVMFGDLTCVEIVLHLFEVERRSAPQHGEGAGALAEARIRHRDDRDLRDRRMVGQQLFHFGYGNFLAAAIDDVAHATGDSNVSGVVHDPEIAGAKPAVGGKCGGRPFRMIRISREHRGRLDFEVSLVTGGQRASVGIGNAQANAAQRPSVGSPNLGRFVARSRRAIRDTIPSYPMRRRRPCRGCGWLARPIPRGTAAPVATKIRSAVGGRSPSSTALTTSAKKGVAACTNVPSQSLRARNARDRIPDGLNDLRNAHDDRKPHAVEKTGLMREWRRHEYSIFCAESQMLDLHCRSAHEHVVAVKHALGLARSS